MRVLAIHLYQMTENQGQIQKKQEWVIFALPFSPGNYPIYYERLLPDYSQITVVTVVISGSTNFLAKVEGEFYLSGSAVVS